MTISTEIEAKILRYYHVEKWRIGTIARQLHVHHSTVERILSKSEAGKELLPKKELLLDRYLPFVLDMLNKYPTLTASRLYSMVCERGYKGSPDHFRHLVASHRPRYTTEAYLRLKTLPGEQAQVDWGHFGHIIIGKAKRPLMAFVMALSFSRKIFLRFFLNQKTENFLRGHEAAFIAYNGVPKVLLYDNLKAAVLERQGDAIRFNPVLLEFAGHYRFEPRPVAVARGNEKGRVERAIRYIREHFFAARKYTDLDDLNEQAALWCDGFASNRPCPEDTNMTVQEAFLQEQQMLIELPKTFYPTYEHVDARTGKTPYIRFDLNDYSIPFKYVKRTLTVIGEPKKISILDGANIIATHQRSYDKGQQIEDQAHIDALVQRKRKARHHRGQDRITKAIPEGAVFLVHAAKRGYNLRAVTSQLLQLLDDYGAAELAIAMKEALLKNVPHPNSVRLSLERRREERLQPPPIAIKLPNDQRVREMVVRPHSLTTYDQLQFSDENNKSNEGGNHE
jgi:transposase